MNKAMQINPKQLGKILVIMGGKTKEREISLMSGRAAYDSLKRQGCDVELLDWKDNDSLMKLCEMISLKKVDRVFIALHGVLGEDGCLQGLLECFGIPYTGSGVLSSSLCMDKVYAKAILRSYGMPVLNDIFLNNSTNNDTSISEIEAKLGYPICIKPVYEGSSVGVKRANNKDELRAFISELLAEYDDIMIEPWIEGREITVGFFNGEALPVLEIRVPKKQDSSFYDYNAKYFSDETEYVFPDDLDENQKEIILEISRKTFEMLKGNDWGRVDLILDNRTNSVYILELNTIPGLTSHSLVPMGAKKRGFDFDSLVLGIAANASSKNKENQANIGKIKVN